MFNIKTLLKKIFKTNFGKNATYSLYGFLAQAIINFVFVGIYSRSFEKSEFSFLIYLLGILLIFATLDGGLGASIIKILLENENKPDKQKKYSNILLASGFIYFIYNLLFSYLIFLYAENLYGVLFSKIDLDKKLVLGIIQKSSILFFLQRTSIFLQFLTKGTNKFAKYFYLVLITNLSMNLGLTWGILRKYPFETTFHCCIIFMLIGVLFMYLKWGRELLVFRYIDFSQIRIVSQMIFRQTILVFISNISALLILQTDKVIIGARLGLHSAAVFELAKSIPIRGYALTGAFSSAVLAEATKNKDNSLEFKNSFIIIFLLVVSVMFLFFISLFILAYPILELWIGKDFASESFIILQILSLAYFWGTIHVVPYNYAFTNNKLFKVFITCQVLFSLVITVTQILLVNIVGLNGMAYLVILGFLYSPITILIFHMKVGIKVGDYINVLKSYKKKYI